jgi:histidinol-phosphate aminotransferase
MPNQPKFLDHIDRMTGYIPGEQPRQGQVIKLNTNENPYPPSPKILETIRESVTQDLRKYPDAGASGVRSRLSNILGAPAENFVIGNGSDELLNVILRCFAGPGDRVVFPTPTYPYYDKLIALQDAVGVPVPLDHDFNLPLDDLVQEDARVTLLANPNSPTGIGLSIDQLDELAQRVSGILVIDEAYVDFSQHQAIGVARKHKHVIVTRTLSKSFSLAGIRVGFAFASPEIIAGLWKVKEHYNVSSLSLVAAEAALDDIGSMHDHARRVVATRERLAQQLRQRDFFVWESQANFVLARLPAGPDQPGDARPLYEGLKDRGYLVRYLDGQPRLTDCLRISIGTDDQIDGLLGAIDETNSQT